MAGRGPSANEILYAIQPKSGHHYPLWQQPFFVLTLMTNVHGVCQFQIELRLEEIDRESVVQKTDMLSLDLGNAPLRVQPVSIMMKAAELPKRGVYHLCFVWNGQTLAKATIHAR